MKKFSLLPALFIVPLSVACNNDDDGNIVTPAQATSYYFNFKLDGQQVNLTANRPQYLAWTASDVGGYQYSTDDSTRFMQLAFRFNAKPSNTDVLDLAGQTFHFGDTIVRPNLLYSASASTDLKNSIDSAGSQYSITVSSSSFVKTDTSFMPVDVYLIKGTCSALLNGSPNPNVLTNGEFQMLVSRIR